ncbi:MAG: peptidase [Oscillatoriales cyanobacterium]|nr:MAG: peptidase [Oscillatoriales cyanobacterium]
MTAIQEQAIKPAPFDDLIADFNKIRSLYTVEEPLEAFKLIIEQEVMLSVILPLEVKTDPEIANWRSLWITIYTKLEVDEALAKLQTLDRTWWLDAGLVISQNKLNIDLGWE